MVIRFVFSAIEQNEPGISPIESTVSLLAHIVQQPSQVKRIRIAYFVIASQIKDRFFRSSDQAMIKRECLHDLIFISRSIEHIAIEDHKIIVYPFYLFAQGCHCLKLLMNIIENKSSKTGFPLAGHPERIKRRNSRIAEGFAIRCIFQDFPGTNPVIIGLAGFQIFQADFVDMIVTNGLSVEHRPGFLQLQGIRTVFHPAVYRYMSQPADRNSISRQAL